MGKGRGRDHTWLEGRPEFQTTEWTKVLGASLSQSVMAELYARYRKPVFLYLRRRGFDEDLAKDLVQDFFTDKVLGQQFFDKADRTKGKFRTFLLTAVRNFAIDRTKPSRSVRSLDQDQDREPVIPACTGDPAEVFNKAWAVELLDQTLHELDAECQAHGKPTHWEVFRQWLLEPDPAEEAGMEEICRRLGIDEPATAYNMLANLKGRFRKIFRRRLRCQVHTESEVDEEIRDFLAIFSD